MKVLAIGHLTGKDITPYLEAEGRRVAELRADGLIRDVFLKADRSGPILLLNGTSAAEARRSLAITGAPLKGLPPFTIALGPSISMSAPRRASSLTCMKRDSKMRSVMMLMPGAKVIRAMTCAWASVGNPA